MKGEMCVLHRTVLKHPSVGEKQFIMHACDSRCPKYGKK